EVITRGLEPSTATLPVVVTLSERKEKTPSVGPPDCATVLNAMPPTTPVPAARRPGISPVAVLNTSAVVTVTSALPAVTIVAGTLLTGKVTRCVHAPAEQESMVHGLPSSQLVPQAPQLAA